MTGPSVTHLFATGEANMVDVGDKPATTREASAEGFVVMAPETLALVVAGDARKRRSSRCTRDSTRS